MKINHCYFTISEIPFEIKFVLLLHIIINSICNNMILFFSKFSNREITFKYEMYLFLNDIIHVIIYKFSNDKYKEMHAYIFSLYSCHNRIFNSLNEKYSSLKMN
jgi:hypothetical protein